MPYEGTVRTLLEDADAGPGDEVEVTTADGRTHRGVVMPHHAFSDPRVLTLKLDHGYNVGVALTEDADVTLLDSPHRDEAGAREIPRREDLPAVAILGTGGTIASYVDYRTGAVHPATSPEELAFADPDLLDVADLRARVVFQAFSEDLTPDHWVQLAQEIRREFEAGVHGVVVPHGTDTMGYTSAALSFMLRDLPGPVVLVGAQRSSDRPSTDADLNLRTAVHLAATADLGEVVVCMHGSTSDDVCHVHRGTRVRKMHTSRRDAFRSVNAPILGTADGADVDLADDARPPSDGPPTILPDLDEDVRLVHAVPGLDAHDVPGPDEASGLVLAGTGLGHVPRRVLPALEAHVDAGHPVVMASQCLHGRLNMHVYSTGRDLLELGVVPAGDMLPETAYVKLMHALAHGDDPAEVRERFLTPVAGELSERTLPSTYPGAPEVTR